MASTISLTRHVTESTADGFLSVVRGLRRICLWLAGACAVVLAINYVYEAATQTVTVNPLVLNARLAFWPLVAVFALLFALDFLSSLAGPGQILGTLVAIIIFLTIIESFLGDSMRRQIFPGTDYFWNHVWPMVWATILLGIDFLTAWIFMRSWKQATSLRDKLGTLLLAVSVVPALIAYAALVLPGMEDMATVAFWALVLFLLGIGLITTRENLEPNSPEMKLRENQR